MGIATIVFVWVVCSVLTYIYITSTAMNKWGDVLGVSGGDILFALVFALLGPVGLVGGVLGGWLYYKAIIQKPHIILRPRKPGERK